jgi:hypothetical protein
VQALKLVEQIQLLFDYHLGKQKQHLKGQELMLQSSGLEVS